MNYDELEKAFFNNQWIVAHAPGYVPAFYHLSYENKAYLYSPSIGVISKTIFDVLTAFKEAADNNIIFDVVS